MDRGDAADATTALATALDRLADIPADALDAAPLARLIEDLERQRRRVEHLQARLVARFAERECHKPDYVTIGQWGVDRLGCRRSTIDRLARVGGRLATLPMLDKAFSVGDISLDHVAAVLRARTPSLAELFDAEEGWFAEKATLLTPSHLDRLAAEWRMRQDPDGEDRKHERAERERDAHVSTTFDDTVAFSGHLPALGGRVLSDVFHDIYDELHRADRTEATERLGREPTADELGRTPAQRRADTIVEIARRARSHMNRPDTAHTPRPLLIILAGEHTLASTLFQTLDGKPLTPSQIAQVLADCDLDRFVYDTAQRPIAYNARHRFFSGKLRAAIEARDRTCQAAGCDAPLRHTQVDHITPVAEGGATAPDNGRLACGPCNRTRPHRRFRSPPASPDDPDPPSGADPPG